MFGSVDARTDARTDGHTDAQTPARVPSYKLTLWAFGSGELKIRTKEKFAVITLKFEQGTFTIK